MLALVTPKPLPELAPGVTVEVLRRVWFATPADRKHQRSSLLESIVTVDAGSQVEAKPLRDLTLAEVESCIGAVTPKFFVRYWRQGKQGVQFATFVERSDADKFASENKLYGEPCKVGELVK